MLFKAKGISAPPWSRLDSAVEVRGHVSARFPAWKQVLAISWLEDVGKLFRCAERFDFPATPPVRSVPTFRCADTLR